MNNTTENKNLNKIIREIATTCKIIANKISFINNSDNSSSELNVTNYHGETVKVMDIITNDLFISSLSKIKDVCGLVSEENTDVISINDSGSYIVAFDPLDGSLNLDVNINVGSIFSIYKRVSNVNSKVDISDFLQQGKNIIAGGYCMYGASTVLVIGYNKSVNFFTLDPSCGEFIMTHSDVKIPKEQQTYSINEGNRLQWIPSSIGLFVDEIKKLDKPYSLRYIGSMVADVHRTLLYGGIFMYPAAKNALSGKLRYLYEVAPLSFVLQLAGGKSMVTANTNALDCIPKSIHQRVPIYMGSENCMNLLNGFLD